MRKMIATLNKYLNNATPAEEMRCASRGSLTQYLGSERARIWKVMSWWGLFHFKEGGFRVQKPETI